MGLILFLLVTIAYSKVIVLDPTLKPSPLSEVYRVNQEQTRKVLTESVRKFENPGFGASNKGSSKPVGNKTVYLGTQGLVYMDFHDKGFFSTVLNAYANHWDLITRPDDWWFTILRRIAIAIDENSDDDQVRQFMVSHEGKKE